MTPHRARLSRRLLLALSPALLSTGWAQSQPWPAPTELAQALPSASLAGKTRFRVWGFEVYDAGLWVQPGFNAAGFEAHPLALELRYLRDLTAQDIAERSLKEMRRLAPVSAEQSKRWLDEMRRIFPNVKTGDRLLGVQQPGQGATFWFNGQLRGDIRDAEFARLFFGIWLSPRSSEPGMRQALLGTP